MVDCEIILYYCELTHHHMSAPSFYFPLHDVRTCTSKSPAAPPFPWRQMKAPAVTHDVLFCF